jgi:hypothetical protein
MNSEYWRARVLVALASQLPADLLAEALTTARQLTWENHRAEVLAALAPLVSALPPSSTGVLWQESLSVLARRPRHELLTDLRVLVAPLSAAGGERAVTTTAQAIIDIGRWWP